MKTVDFTIDKEDLKVLFVHTGFVYQKMNLEQFIKQVKKDYTSYLIDRENPKNFSQWVNGQIISLS